MIYFYPFCHIPFCAWFMWLALHLFFLIGFRNRVVVMFLWLWYYTTFQRGARIITSNEVFAPRRNVARAQAERNVR